jgi:hypothetical protein
MNPPARQTHPRRRPAAAPAEEELETGEPIAEEMEPAAPPADPNKIPAKGGTFNARPWEQSRSARSGDSADSDSSGGTGDGQVELATAKYLKKRPKDSADRKGRKAQASSTAESGGRSLEGNVFNSGMAGGLLAMIGAVVWFIAGLMNDVIFFYPPILFVIGLGAFFKGMAGGSDS